MRRPHGGKKKKNASLPYKSRSLIGMFVISDSLNIWLSLCSAALLSLYIRRKTLMYGKAFLKRLVQVTKIY